MVHECDRYTDGPCTLLDQLSELDGILKVTSELLMIVHVL